MSDFVIKNGVLTKYTGSGGDVVIPDEVIKIGNKAFEWCKNLQNVTIPKNIAKIGNNAFHGCENLQNVIIPEGVKKIEDRTFCGCKKLQNIVIPKSVIEIGKDAFCGCESLQNIAIPENVTVIEGAFSYCKNLQSIVVPKSVVKISDGTFFGCTKIKLIVLDEKLLFCTESMVDSSYGLVVKSENGISLFARSSKTLSNNKIDFIDKGDWNAYDVDIINNGPCYKYRAEARFLGALGTNTLNRLLDVFPPAQQPQIRAMTAGSMRGIVCQQLIPDGFGGLTLVYEIMLNTMAVSNIISEGKAFQLKSTMAVGVKQGMCTMDQCILEKFNQGLITYEAGRPYMVDSATIAQMEQLHAVREAQKLKAQAQRR